MAISVANRMSAASKLPAKKEKPRPKRNLFDDIIDPVAFVLREAALPIPDTLIGMAKKKKKGKEVTLRRSSGQAPKSKLW